VTIPCAAAVVALTRLAAKRLALINPPWFSIEMDQNGARYLKVRALRWSTTDQPIYPRTSKRLRRAKFMTGSACMYPSRPKLYLLAAMDFAPSGLFRRLKKNWVCRCDRKSSRVLARSAAIPLAGPNHELRPDFRV